MRSEQEMINLILDVAKRDDRIRVVLMNGSRCNPNVPRDIFQDYDIVYLVTEMDSFLADRSWIDVFGERIIMQMPEDMSMFPPDLGGNFSYLMLFTDGNRIDLTLEPLKGEGIYRIKDKLTIVLLDKDNRIQEIPVPTDEDYRVKPPSEAFFNDCWNGKLALKQTFLLVQANLESI